jgi:hypothetical protein
MFSLDEFSESQMVPVLLYRIGGWAANSPSLRDYFFWRRNIAIRCAPNAFWQPAQT